MTTVTSSLSSSTAAVLKPVNSSIATTSTAVRHVSFRSDSHILNTLLRSALHHVQQSCWAGAVADRGQVDDHMASEIDAVVTLVSPDPFHARGRCDKCRRLAQQRSSPEEQASSVR